MSTNTMSEPSRLRRWTKSAVDLAFVVLVVLAAKAAIAEPFYVPSGSMEPTLLIGDELLATKYPYGYSTASLPALFELPSSPRILSALPQRGDVVVFRWPGDRAQVWVKRVIGLPGDHIRLQDRQVLVNGVAVAENYVIHTKPDYDRFRDDFPLTDIPSANMEPRWWEEMGILVRNGELIVPPDRYFVLGDNRDESLDSRYWGCVPREYIIGRPLLIYWSVRAPRAVADASSGRGDKLSAFLYGVTHLVQDTRWDRTFRIVR